MQGTFPVTMATRKYIHVCIYNYNAIHDITWRSFTWWYMYL